MRITKKATHVALLFAAAKAHEDWEILTDDNGEPNAVRHTASGQWPDTPDWCSRLVPDAPGPQSAFDDGAVNPIPVANKILRGVLPRKCFRYSTSNPFCRRVCCDIDADQVLRSSRTMTSA
jgi:hypothetical protein